MNKEGVWLLLSLFIVAETTRQTVFIGGMFPMSGAWAGGKGCRPAVEMALKSVNSRSDLFPTFNLEMISNDSQVM